MNSMFNPGERLVWYNNGLLRDREMAKWKGGEQPTDIDISRVSRFVPLTTRSLTERAHLPVQRTHPMNTDSLLPQSTNALDWASSPLSPVPANRS